MLTLMTDQNDVFVPLLGQSVKGTVQAVVADILGAHGIGGFVESLSGEYFCRFCLGKKFGHTVKRDVMHDLFEGIMPVELDQCLALLIDKKYFTLQSLNESIQHFPYKWAEASGHTVPEDEPACQMLMDLKDIVELVVALVHAEESVAYLETKISELRHKYQLVVGDMYRLRNYRECCFDDV
ncbi:hypothetical protein MHYP_G00052240 [Metynnis hypsauchen]